MYEIQFHVVPYNTPVKLTRFLFCGTIVRVVRAKESKMRIQVEDTRLHTQDIRSSRIAGIPVQHGSSKWEQEDIGKIAYRLLFLCEM